MTIKKKYAILIGINDLPNYQYLETPAQYATKMHKWAQSQGYKGHLFVDEDEHGKRYPVTISLLQDTIRQLLEDNPEQLLIYFAGHGIELSAGNDIWLLPGYDQNPNEAINLFQNKQLAYETGADHVIFISDSCRAPSGSKDLRHINGSAIFPKARKTNYKTEIDILYSTWPGQPSVDYKDDNGNYKSIYSECLLNCLNGHVAEVIRQLEKINPTFPAVVPDELSRYLRTEVPKQMASIGITQHPMGEVTSRDPIHLAQFPQKYGDAASNQPETVMAEPIQPNSKPMTTVENRLYNFLELGIAGQNTNRLRQNIATLKRNYRNTYKLLYENPLPWDYNFRDYAGLLVNGSNSLDIYLNEFHDSWRNIMYDIRIPFNFWPIMFLRKDDYTSAPIIISNRNKTWFYPIHLLPGFCCQVDFIGEQLMSVSYYPLSEQYRMVEAYQYRGEVANRRAAIIVAAQKAILQGTEELADYIRKYKALDPILGLFAAYAYFQKGLYADVRSVYDYMGREREPVINDVRILNALSSYDGFGKIGDIQFPILTEGWSYLNLLTENPLKDLEVDLVPGLWTAFSKNGLKKIVKRFNYKKLR